MTLLIVISVLVLLICLLLFSHIKVRVRASESFSVRAGIGVFTFPLHPKKEKRIKLKDFSQKKYLKKIEKLRAKEKTKKEKSEKGKADASAVKEKKTFSETADFIIHLLSKVEKYTARLKTDIRELSVVVGGKEADKTAVTYGVLSQTAAYLLEVLGEKTKLVIRDPDKVSVKSDFLTDKITFTLDVTVSTSVLDAVKTVYDILVTKLSHDTKIKNKSQKERTN